MAWKLGLAVLLLLTGGLLFNSAQECLQGSGGFQREIPFEDLQGGGAPYPIQLLSGSQAIVTSYQFQCCGDVTEWQTYMQPGGGNHDGVYTVNFQVWRPYPVSGGDQYYSLVRENIFPTVTLTDRRVSETPQPTNRISVRPGDVLGYFVSGGQAGRNEGIQMHPDFPMDEVVYADLGGNPLFSPGDCSIVSVGPGGVLSSTINAAPVISVRLSTSNCPPAPITSICSSLYPTPTPKTDPSTNPPTDLPTNPPTDPPTNPHTSAQLPGTVESTLQHHPLTDTNHGNIVPTTTQPTADKANTNTTESSTPTARQDPVSIVLVAGPIAGALVLTAAGTIVVVIMLLIRRRARKKSSKTTNDYATTNAGFFARDEIVNLGYATTSIPVETNQCYGTTTPSVGTDQLYATVEGEHQPQDMELTRNQAYATTVSDDTNKPSDTASLQQGDDEYDYITPY